MPSRSGAAVLVGLLDEAQPHARGLGADAGDQLRAEVLHEALAGAQREGAFQPARGRAPRRGGGPPRRPAQIRPTRSRSSTARGVGTRPRPARTSSGSPVVSRRRASDRLIAEGLSRGGGRARVTLPSASTTSSVTSRLRSGRDTAPRSHDMASDATRECNSCGFRHAPAGPSVGGDAGTRHQTEVGPGRAVAGDAAVVARNERGQRGAPDVGGRVRRPLRRRAVGGPGLPAGRHDTGGQRRATRRPGRPAAAAGGRHRDLHRGVGPVRRGAVAVGARRAPGRSRGSAPRP